LQPASICPQLDAHRRPGSTGGPRSRPLQGRKTVQSVVNARYASDLVRRRTSAHGRARPGVSPKHVSPARPGHPSAWTMEIIRDPRLAWPEPRIPGPSRRPRPSRPRSRSRLGAGARAGSRSHLIRARDRRAASRSSRRKAVGTAASATHIRQGGTC
jgi:hypothetical protein